MIGGREREEKKEPIYAMAVSNQEEVWDEK